MFMVAILGAVLLMGVVLWVIATRANHKSRAGQSGVGEVNKQANGNGGPVAQRATGSD